jgi:hypothetical protein
VSRTGALASSRRGKQLGDAVRCDVELANVDVVAVDAVVGGLVFLGQYGDLGERPHLNARQVQFQERVGALVRKGASNAELGVIWPDTADALTRFHRDRAADLGCYRREFDKCLNVVVTAGSWRAVAAGCRNEARYQVVAGPSLPLLITGRPQLGRGLDRRASGTLSSLFS